MAIKSEQKTQKKKTTKLGKKLVGHDLENPSIRYV